MSHQQVTKTFSITCDPRLMVRIERFLNMIYFNSQWGHSSLFGIFIDGDGADQLQLDPINRKYKEDINLIGGASGGVEVARDDGYEVVPISSEPHTYWMAKDGILYRDGKVYKRYGQ